jgi:hypothetical protein
VHVDAYEFGRITIDGVVYDHDVVIESGEIRKRKKGPSKPRRDEFGHTPLTAEEKLPWSGKRLWIGTGASGLLPVTDELRREARRRGVELLIESTHRLVERINQGVPAGTSLILHVTC